MRHLPRRAEEADHTALSPQVLLGLSGLVEVQTRPRQTKDLSRVPQQNTRDQIHGGAARVLSKAASRPAKQTEQKSLPVAGSTRVSGLQLYKRLLRKHKRQRDRPNPQSFVTGTTTEHSPIHTRIGAHAFRWSNQRPRGANRCRRHRARRIHG